MSSIDYREIARLAVKGRRAEERGKAAKGCITGLATAALLNLAHGFWLMVAVGILHAEWWAALPTIGYWWAVLSVALLRGVFSPMTPSKKDKS